MLKYPQEEQLLEPFPKVVCDGAAPLLSLLHKHHTIYSLLPKHGHYCTPSNYSIGPTVIIASNCGVNIFFMIKEELLLNVRERNYCIVAYWCFLYVYNIVHKYFIAGILTLLFPRAKF